MNTGHQLAAALINQIQHDDRFRLLSKRAEYCSPMDAAIVLEEAASLKIYVLICTGRGYGDNAPQHAQMIIDRMIGEGVEADRFVPVRVWGWGKSDEQMYLESTAPLPF